MSRGPDPSVGSDDDRLPPHPRPQDGAEVEADDTFQTDVDRLVALILEDEDEQS